MITINYWPILLTYKNDGFIKRKMMATGGFIRYILDTFVLKNLIKLVRFTFPKSLVQVGTLGILVGLFYKQYCILLFCFFVFG